ncbi:sodium-dependent acetylcholine transporter-like [Haemaphysalis longicornis]
MRLRLPNAFQSRYPMPTYQGVGWAMVYACVLLSSFNSLVLAYVLIFLYYSATWSTLPWTECGRDWTDDRCYVKSAGIFSCRTLERMVLHVYKHDWLPEAVTRRQLGEVNATDVYVITSDDFGHCINATEVSSQQFFYKRVLGFNSQGKEEEDQPSYQGHLFLAVTVGWCCVFACVHNGVRSLGKVIYITTVLTFMLFSILLTRVLTLPGASVGLQQYLVPKWKAMLSLTATISE